MAVSSSSTTTRMTSLTGGRAAARVVAGSRRPARRPSPSTTMIRASHTTTEEEDCDNTPAAKPIVTIAGKAVSAVVAAAVSLSSATHAAQAQVVRAPTSSLSLSLSSFCADVIRGVVGVGVFLFDAMDEKDIVVRKRSRIGSR